MDHLSVVKLMDALIASSLTIDCSTLYAARKKKERKKESLWVNFCTLCIYQMLAEIFLQLSLSEMYRTYLGVNMTSTCLGLPSKKKAFPQWSIHGPRTSRLGANLNETRPTSGVSILNEVLITGWDQPWLFPPLF